MSAAMQIKGQISLYDIVSEDVEMGYVDETHIGVEIPFTELKNFIDKKVVYCYLKNEDGKLVAKSGRMIIIKDYYEGMHPVYMIEKNDGPHYYNDFYPTVCPEKDRALLKQVFTGDSIGYCDGKRTKCADHWTQEIYSSTSRFPEYKTNASLSSFFKYKP